MATGAVAAWGMARKKYEQIAQEEIDSVKEQFSRRAVQDGRAEETAKEEDDGDKDSEPEEPHRKEHTAYQTMIERCGYANKECRKEEGVERPYVIKPEEFGEFGEYETISLTYYADQILADDGDELVEDVEGTVGFESLGHFGEYEDDSVFVRNDRLKCDYEILLDSRNYADVRKAMPRQIGG
jgi:hypothetical protein